MERRPTYVEIASVLDFSRLVCALEGVSRVSFLHEHLGKKVLSVQMDMLKNQPVIYYTPSDDVGHYLCYGFRAGQEESSMVDSTADTSQMYSPIVKIRSMPKSLLPSDGGETMYNPIVLEDLSSLAKLSYGIEEASFPLFVFPHQDKWMIGVFMTFTEEGSSYFCHVQLDEEPKKPFMKFTLNNGETPSFVSSPDQHGYSYVKLVKLSQTHPLVDYDQIQN